ncbi:hypothetical protein QTN47_21060 [Danxiaibacter flavus]|uniref:Carboxypeptidase regulatory-like domain-containing protein n=1 Tax=Danxiaibacter flavus TaxID=3049108 RepID=A0ABV3ZJE8_9BACT|nr:hypothetical protein QNM32_21065 [Chitinophagaceae bacterium DXS]
MPPRDTYLSGTICRSPHLFYFVFIFFVSLSLLYCNAGKAQVDDNLNYYEISITLNVPKIGGSEIPAIVHGQRIYLPVKDLFDFLKIRNILSAGMDSVTGFFINPQVTYLIDEVNHRIRYDEKIFELKPNDLVKTETGLYLNADYFREAFGLDCIFNFRSLSVTLNTQIDLPAIREMQQELMRRNISRLKGEKQADTTIARKFSMFHLGSADWSIVATQQSNSGDNTRANLNMGAFVAGGEANVSLNYTSAQPFNQKQQYYSWRYVNNDHSSLRQVTAGKLLIHSTSSIYAPVVGVQFTNTPTTYRKSFGTYKLTDRTEPGWMVELYVNNILLDYKKADSSGFFTFEVPMVYGNSVVKLRVYGPWGEERYREQNIIIPFNFLPQNEFQYTVTAGRVEDEQKSLFYRTDVNYGFTRHITIGTGVEYLSSLASDKSMPYLNASFRLGSKLLITADHTYGVRSNATISYSLSSKAQVNVSYTKYDKDQTAVKYNYLEERKIELSIPLHSRNFNALSRLKLGQFILPNTKYTTAEYTITGVFAGISSNLTTYGMFSQHPYVYSNFTQTYRLLHNITFSPQMQFDYTRKRFNMFKCEAGKNISTKGYLNFSYQRDFNIKTSYLGIGFRYNFSFGQASFFATQSNHTSSLVESARGSFLYDDNTNYLRANNRIGVGKGGLIILSYLDINGNGHRDLNEPKVAGLKLHINGGITERNDRDTIIRILELEAFSKYLIELDKNSFDNIAWQIKKPNISVTIEPNHLTLIEVAVTVAGEASGIVSLCNNNKTNGLSRIIINFYDSNFTRVAHTLTEPGGYFTFMGFTPGTYTARLDTAQLHNLNLTCTPETITFNIQASEDGVIVDNLEFKVQSLLDTSKQVAAKKEVGGVKASDSSIQYGNKGTLSQQKTLTGEEKREPLSDYKQKYLIKKSKKKQLQEVKKKPKAVIPPATQNENPLNLILKYLNLKERWNFSTFDSLLIFVNQFISHDNDRR